MTIAKRSEAMNESVRTSTGPSVAIRWISFALLFAAAPGAGNVSTDNLVRAFGVSTAYASEQTDKNAPAKLDGGEMTDGWLYLGRRSADRWRPSSLSISHPRYPVKPGNRVVLKQDALVYGSVDCKVIDAADFKADGTSRSVLLVKADKKGLEIAGSTIECPSIGRAKTVWANVKIPAIRLVSVEK